MAIPYEWGETNDPTEGSDDVYKVMRSWPAGLVFVDLPKNTKTLVENIKALAAFQKVAFILVLPKGFFKLFTVPLVGVSGRQDYAYALFNDKLQGFLGTGCKNTFVALAPNAISQEQLDCYATMDPRKFTPNALGMVLLQPKDKTDVYMGGLTFVAYDQPPIKKIHPELAKLGVVVPQPAPHGGVVVGQWKNLTCSYVKFQGNARALMGRPPFEHGPLGQQYGKLFINNCWFSGARDARVDPYKPRRCGSLMMNNPSEVVITDTTFRDTNVSRVAHNAENKAIDGDITFLRCSFVGIGNQNIDPRLNGGKTLGGYTNAANIGFESSASNIKILYCLMTVDNPGNDSVHGRSTHISLTHTGSRNPQNGRLLVKGGVFRNKAWPVINGFLTMSISITSYWWLDGLNNTITVLATDGSRKTPWVHTGTWPPTVAQMAAAKVNSKTHYIVRKLG